MFSFVFEWKKICKEMSEWKWNIIKKDKTINEGEELVLSTLYIFLGVG